MKLNLNGFLDGGFDSTQKLKATNILDASVSRNLCIKYNDIPVNVGAYDEDQKDIFIKVFNSFDWDSHRSVSEQMKDILKLLKGNFSKDDFDAIYNNALDVAFFNSDMIGTLEEIDEVVFDISDELNACLDELKTENKPKVKIRK